MNLTVIKAIFKRDFVSYFSSPTGYVFICVFVMLSALATFFPAAFFNNMLANLDQLSYYMPWILLVFIPAITMSTWSEERRQGTDELLLTIPATDFDVVLGKYVAACAIFTVSLLFSLFSIWLVFGYGLGTPDTGLFFSTYLGYWFLGIAMLAIGMVASFLTRNLTVGFVLGMVFIAPLVALSQIDLILTNLDYAQFFTRWSASSQLADFQRGVISLSGVTYFVSIAAVMLYICMVLISKRHWGTGEDGDSRWGHYLVRAIALLVIAGGLNIFISNYDHLRLDATSENINSLSSATIDLLEKIEENDQVGTILIDAYVSPQVPAEYAAHKLNLLGTLKELQSRSGGKIRTNVYEIESFSPQAETAEAAFDITPQRVAVTSQGRSETKDIFMGIAVRHKLDKVVVPFVNKGIPVEYELVRSIATVAAESRKRVGVIKTDAPLFESFSMQGMTPESRLVAELRKQYEVVEVDPEQPITGTFDVLLAVQPSAMSSEAMNHLTQAVKSGMPIAIFEDPMPAMWGPPPVPGTDQPRQAGGGPMAMFGGGQPLPKGEIHQLWQLLGVSMAGDEIVLQDYNPYPQIQFTPDFVIIDNEGLQAQGTTAPFNPDDPITSGMDQILLVRSGSLRKSASGRTSVESLIVTGPLTGTVSYEQLASVGDDFTWNSNTQLSNESFIMAVRVRGEVESDEDELKALDLTQAGRDGEGDKPDDPTPVKKNPINAIVVSDIDCLSDPFFQVREEGDRSWAQIPEFRFQNVAMVLNILDDLAGDDRFIEIRKRTPNRPGLTQIDAATKEARAATRKKIDEFEKQRNEQFAEAQKEFDDRLAAIDNRTDLSREQKSIMRARTMIRAQQKLMKERSASKHDHDRQVAATQRKLEQDIRAIQNRYKAFAFFLPPIPPILLGIFVFIHRRLGEREGVAKSRLRYTKKESAA